MPAILSNLLARAPRIEDLRAIIELRSACDIADHGISNSTREAILAEWQELDFNLGTDAWVIVATRNRCVAYAHLIHNAVLCVHPACRRRGIGMLLLRIVEARVHEQMKAAPPGVGVSLKVEVSHSNEAARMLLVREGYSPVRHFLRLNLAKADELCESCKEFYQHANLHFDLVFDVSDLMDTAHVQQHDGPYIGRLYDIYEKEVRPSTKQPANTMSGEGLAVA